MDSTSMGLEKEDTSLIRGKKSVIETLFIVGNGAIDGGNTPLDNAIKQAQEGGFFHFKSNLLGSIPSLSYVSHKERSLFDDLILLSKGHWSTSSEEEKQSHRHLLLWKLCSYSITLRIILSDSYLKPSKPLRIRSPVREWLDLLGICNESSACVTTNWDNSLWDIHEIKTIAHLHGRCTDPVTLILPTETISEKKLKKVLIDDLDLEMLGISHTQANDFKAPTFSSDGHSINLFQLISKIDSFDQSKPIDLVNTIQIYYAHNLWIEKLIAVEIQFRAWLKNAKHIVIAGIAFNDYDHELMSTIAENAKGNKCKITIINRETKQGDRKVKLEKVKGLFPCHSSITFLNTARG